MIQLQDQVVLITGASRGIGAAAAVMFAEAGAHVGIVYLSHDDEAEAVKLRVEAYGRKALLLKGDVSQLATAKDHAAAMMEQFGRIDVLVNNVGIWNFLETGKGGEEVWDRLMAVNLKSVFNYCDAVVPHMKAAKSGNIIHVTSTAGQRGEAHHSHYAASKGAMISHVKSLAVELAPHIRVNGVAPGWVDTPMNEKLFGDKQFVAEIKAGIPLNRIPPAEDLAGPIVFLASQLARHITGEIINVNGGAVLCG